MASSAVPGVLDALGPYATAVETDQPDEFADRIRSRTAFWARGGIASATIGAIETALWDALGKSEGKPVSMLLGGPEREHPEVYASGGLGRAPSEVIDWVRAQQREGFGTVKFRAMQDADRTVELVEEVCDALGPATEFVVDAVQGCAATPWSVNDAVRVGTVLAARGARWYEEPCHAEDVAGYAIVRSQVEVPVSGVESFGSHHEFARLIDAGGVDIAQPDVSLVGGISEFRRVTAHARAHGVSVVPHIWGSGVTLMANVHAAFADASVALVEYCAVPNPLRERLLTEPLPLDAGRLAPPTAPGLGVALPPGIETEFPYRHGAGHVIT